MDLISNKGACDASTYHYLNAFKIPVLMWGKKTFLRIRVFAQSFDQGRYKCTIHQVCCIHNL